jgi:transmembrane sensor
MGNQALPLFRRKCPLLKIFLRMNKELLGKYFNNCCDDEELAAVLTWFKESSGTSEGKALLFSMWEELREEGEDYNVDFNLILDKIHHKVNLTKTESLLERSDQNPVQFRRREYFLKVLTRVAAILMLPVLGFGLYMTSRYYSSRDYQVSVNQAYNEVFSSVDAITKVTLPDGSNVWLNHSSTLKYPAFFHGDSRTVELIGEGYFEVVHNSVIPFIVKAGEIQIVARGTSFNVLAYPDEDRIETSLITGIVELQRLNSDGRLIPLFQMKPNDLTIYQKGNNRISHSIVEDERYFSWKDGKLIFNKAPMDEVVRKLRRWFNVDIEVKDPKLYELTYTATFVNETLPQVMELLTLVSPASYSISEREKMSDGTYSKRKVILSCRNK